MQEKARLGIGHRMVPLPTGLVKFLMRQEAKQSERRLAFMTADHHRARDFVVRELNRRPAPFSPAYISQQLDLPLKQTHVILNELERGMMFLWRAGGETVVWAYPVTRAETPHRIAYVGEDEHGFAA